MNNDLADVLFEKKLLVKGMELEATVQRTALGNVNTIGITGCFTVLAIKRGTDNILRITCASTVDGTLRVFTPDLIHRLDGMLPNRFALVYNLLSDGSPKVCFKRRGRKRKIDDLNE